MADSDFDNLNLGDMPVPGMDLDLQNASSSQLDAARAVKANPGLAYMWHFQQVSPRGDVVAFSRAIAGMNGQALITLSRLLTSYAVTAKTDVCVAANSVGTVDAVALALASKVGADSNIACTIGKGPQELYQNNLADSIAVDWDNGQVTVSLAGKTVPVKFGLYWARDVLIPAWTGDETRVDIVPILRAWLSYSALKASGERLIIESLPIVKKHISLGDAWRDRGGELKGATVATIREKINLILAPSKSEWRSKGRDWVLQQLVPVVNPENVRKLNLSTRKIVEHVLAEEPVMQPFSPAACVAIMKKEPSLFETAVAVRVESQQIRAVAADYLKSEFSWWPVSDSCDELAIAQKQAYPLESLRPLGPILLVGLGKRVRVAEYVNGTKDWPTLTWIDVDQAANIPSSSSYQMDFFGVTKEWLQEREINTIFSDAYKPVVQAKKGTVPATDPYDRSWPFIFHAASLEVGTFVAKAMMPGSFIMRNYKGMEELLSAYDATMIYPGHSMHSTECYIRFDRKQGDASKRWISMMCRLAPMARLSIWVNKVRNTAMVCGAVCGLDVEAREAFRVACFAPLPALRDTILKKWDLLAHHAGAVLSLDEAEMETALAEFAAPSLASMAADAFVRPRKVDSAPGLAARGRQVAVRTGSVSDFGSPAPIEVAEDLALEDSGSV